MPDDAVVDCEVVQASIRGRISQQRAERDRIGNEVLPSGGEAGLRRAAAGRFVRPSPAPQVHGAIIARARQHPPVGAEGHARDPDRVPLEAAHPRPVPTVLKTARPTGPHTPPISTLTGLAWRSWCHSESR